MSEVTEALARVRERVERAAKRVGRDPDEIVLVGVCKGQPRERVEAALRAGLRDLGENYVQEALRRRLELKAFLDSECIPSPRWHGVGRLQRNKARDAVRSFDLVHTLDRRELAHELARRAGEAGRRLDVLLQVNLSGEPQKAGVAPQALRELLTESAALPELRVRGLMTLPAWSPDPQASRSAFAGLRRLRDELASTEAGGSLRQLSMGMSHDFEVAIEEGATLVRVGTAIFGPREARA